MGKNVYIRGINNVYEFDFGELSGWIYLVNGKQPPVGAGNYIPKDTDVIEWIYTLDIADGL